MSNPFFLPASTFSVGPGSTSTGITSAKDLMFGVPGYSNSESLDNMNRGDIAAQMADVIGITSRNMLKPSGGIGGSAAGSSSGFGANLDTARLAMTGLGTIGNLWAAFQAQKLAKKQFAFTKRITEANLANQVQSYNTTLEDRGRSRAFAEGQSASDAQAYINKNRLTTGG
jgi:hypothetical protein